MLAGRNNYSLLPFYADVYIVSTSVQTPLAVKDNLPCKRLAWLGCRISFLCDSKVRSTDAHNYAAVLFSSLHHDGFSFRLSNKCICRCISLIGDVGGNAGYIIFYDMCAVVCLNDCVWKLLRILALFL